MILEPLTKPNGSLEQRVSDGNFLSNDYSSPLNAVLFPTVIDCLRIIGDLVVFLIFFNTRVR